LITIIVPAYNAEEYLPETVESILSQTVSEWELIIVNDGSHDATKTLAEQFAARDSRIRAVHQDNTGLSGARNRGYEESSPQTRFVIFLDADDLWEPNTLAKLHAALAAHPEAVAAHAIARSINERSQPSRNGSLERAIQYRKAVVDGQVTAWPSDAPTTFSVLAVNCCIVTAGMVLLRRTALEAVREASALFDPMPSLPRASLEDWDLWLRLAQHGEFAVVGETLLNYRSHAGNLSQQKDLMFLGEVYVRQKAAALPGLTADQARVLARGTQHWLATHARRLAAAQINIACHGCRQGQFGLAARRLGVAMSEYLRYVYLRRSRTCLSPDQVRRMLASVSFLRAASGIPREKT